jgi:hypothetical protein
MSKKSISRTTFRWYWICDACAVKMGGEWPPNHVCTATIAKCNYCKSKKEKTVIPWVDYNWPGIDTTRMRD